MLREVLKKAQQEATAAPCDSTLVPNLSREPGTGCPKPTKRCGKIKTSELGWSKELRDGEQRLEALRVQASKQVRAPPATGPGDEVANLKKLGGEQT